ncbi:hypothetical protein JTE90_016711 [Oedothorax gibbosus]|uniref:Uncharacterized protein n=1 Tax=Oedothorax gibbosus TaxID=931172 RepID=A0AAV6V3M2_9ARAC|nr:hypothetical protein JTE90_016711 [Oedothorax gibbosus]
MSKNRLCKKQGNFGVSLLQVVGGAPSPQIEDMEGKGGGPRGVCCKSGGSNRIGWSQKSRRNGRHISHLPVALPHPPFYPPHISSDTERIGKKLGGC